MPKYIAKFRYSSGSYARVINTADDRTTVVQRMLESLGGSLECLYWQLGSYDGYAIGDIPDSVTAEALEEAMTKTGAFRGLEIISCSPSSSSSTPRISPGTPRRFTRHLASRPEVGARASE